MNRFCKNDNHGTPQRLTWITGIPSALLAGVFPIKAVADLTNISILAAFVVVCLSVIIFRYKKPDTPRTFRLPFMPVVPAFGMLASGFLMLELHWETWLRFVIWLLVDLAIYFICGRKHSLMNPDSPRHDECVVLPHSETYESTDAGTAAYQGRANAAFRSRNGDNCR